MSKISGAKHALVGVLECFGERPLYVCVCVYVHPYRIYKFLHVKVAVPFITQDSTTGAVPSFSTAFPLAVAANAVDGPD